MITSPAIRRLALGQAGSNGAGARRLLYILAILCCAALSRPANAAEENEPLLVLEFLNDFDWSSIELACAVQSDAYPDFRDFRLHGLDRLVAGRPGESAETTHRPQCKVKRNHTAYCNWSDGLTQYSLSLDPGETRVYKSSDGKWMHVVPGVISKSFTAKSAVACNALSAAESAGD